MKLREIVIIIVVIFCIGAFVVFNNHLRVVWFGNIVHSSVIDNEGLILPKVIGRFDNDQLLICHHGSRRLNPVTIQHWKSLEGVINVEEKDYYVTITRAPNYAWDEIFPPSKETIRP
jgi:hypothetical protein